MTQKQAAHYLTISEKTLQRLRARNAGPAFVMIAGSLRYRISDLDHFIDSRTTKGGDNR
jgi:hypothetical protein